MNPLGQRILRRIPFTPQHQEAKAAWRDRWTLALMVELTRLGYDAADARTDEDDDTTRITLIHVGARDLTLVLRAVPVTAGGDVTDDWKAERVFCAPHSGERGWTARQATLWLRKRASRERRYLR